MAAGGGLGELQFGGSDRGGDAELERAAGGGEGAVGGEVAPEEKGTGVVGGGFGIGGVAAERVADVVGGAGFEAEGDAVAGLEAAL